MTQDLKVVLRIDGETGKVRFEVENLEKSLDKAGVSGKKSGEKIGQGMDKGKEKTSLLKNEVDGLKKDLIALASIAFATKLTKGMVASADQAKLLRARIDLVTESATEYNIATERTFEIAQDTRTAIDTTVNLYTRLERSLQGTATAQSEVLGITETINKALQVSGATTAEASSVITQLSHGLAAGALRGEEFNAVNESGSRIMQALKDELGKTSGELREMAFAGELTTEVITSALKNQSDVIAAEFGKLPTTVGGALVQLGNANVAFFGSLDESIGFTDKLSSSISFLAENIDVLYSAIGAVLKITVLYAGAKGVGLLIGAFSSLRVATSALTGSMAILAGTMKSAILANPILAAAAGIYGAFELMSSAIDSNNEKLDEMSRLSGDAQSAVQALTDEFNKGFDSAGIEGMTSSLEVLDAELAKIDQKLRLLPFERIQELQNNDKGFAFGQGVEIASNLFSGNGFATNDEVALERQKEAINLTKLQAEANQFLTDTFGDLYQAAKQQTEADKARNEANTKSINDWLESAEKQLEKLQEQNAAYGKSKSEIIALNLAKTKELTTDKQLLAQIDKMGKALLKEANALEAKEAATKAANEAKKREIELLKQAIELSGEQYNAVQSAIDAVETDEERINRVAEQRLDALKKEQASLIISKERYDEISEAIKRTEEARDKELVQLDKGAIARAQLISDLEFEESLIGLSNTERERAIIQRQLEADGIKVSADELERLVRLRKEEIGINPNGGFNNNASFEGLIQGGETLGGILKEAAAGFNQGIEGAANSMNVLLQGAQYISDVWKSTEGKDGTGRVLTSLAEIANTGALGPVAQAISQVATTIDSLTGGKLFGTKYEVKRITQSINLGQGGATGNVETLETRQGSLFSGLKRRRTESAIDSEIQRFYDNVVESALVAVSGITSSFNTQAPDLIEGAFTQEFDKDGNLVKSISEFFGVIREETQEQFASRFLGENYIAALGTRFSEASALAEQFRGDADTLLDAAQTMVRAGADIADGNGLFDNLTQTIETVVSLQSPGESLAETYNKVYQSTIQYEEVLGLMGQTFDGTRQEFVEFATAITDAAGGLERAQDLWVNYLQSFYDPEELLQQQIGSASELLARRASNLGINPNITQEQFREQFEAIRPTLSADEVVQWLELAEAITAVNVLVEEQVDIYQAQLDALNNYAAASQSIQDQINQIEGTDYQNTVAQINRQHEQRIANLNELAQAAGLASAKEQDLANAHRLTALQMEKAIAVLTERVQSLINELYGPEDLDSQIAELEAQQNSGISSVGQASSNLFGQWEQAIDRLRDKAQNLLIDSRFSPLESTERLEEARSQFFAAFEAANNGDLEAAQSLVGLADAVLELNGLVNTSGNDYNEIFYEIRDALNSVQMPDGLGGGQTPTYSVTPSAELQALYDQRAARDDAAMAQHRLELAQQLQVHVAELASAINQPVLQVLEDMGVEVSRFLLDLGINVESATGQTVAQLASVANTFGIEVTALAENVGLSLGELANAQSLLNDGLEATITTLPGDIQENLTGLLRDVESAADGTARDTALGNMEDYISTLPADLQNALAPYFQGIDPITQDGQLLTVAEEQRDLLQQINIALGNFPTVIGGGGLVPDPLGGGGGLPTIGGTEPVATENPEIVGTLTEQLGESQRHTILLQQIRDIQTFGGTEAAGPGKNVSNTPAPPLPISPANDDKFNAAREAELKQIKEELVALREMLNDRTREANELSEIIAINAMDTKENTDRIGLNNRRSSRVDRQGVAYGS